MQNGIIYIAENTVNGNVYIGKTVQGLNERKRKHLICCKKESTKHRYFYHAINKYGAHSFDWRVLQEVSVESIDDAERYWIKYYKEKGVRLYNMTEGGDGTIGYKHTDSAKEKCRVAAIIQTQSEEYRKAHGDKIRGRKLSEEQKRKISENSRGRVVSEESRKKSSISNGFVPFYVISPSGIVHKIEMMKPFCRQHNLVHQSLYKLSRGKLKSHKGWRLYEVNNNDAI